MPLTPTVWGPAVADALLAWAGGNVPQTSFITSAQLQEAWKIITTQHKIHVNDNADIALETADITVEPGSFIDSVTTAPISGTGFTDAVTLTQRIK